MTAYKNETVKKTSTDISDSQNLDEKLFGVHRTLNVKLQYFISEINNKNSEKVSKMFFSS